ncbi:peroxisomal targeting signal 2 receptor [Aplysia californica]|uniref:Peroxin-7 n=1 Tax=Aplysia californica TaxID=6500 RepID=A0ABM0JCM5_APLCA|nr:peroxisomal targeting signal 2 receptor [Aplysia californica]
MNQTFRTKSRHGYSVKFSPYLPQRIACATSQYYGIVGSGSIFVLDVDPSGVRVVQQFEWSEGVFDLTWAENNENILVAAGGDGSIQVWDVSQPQGPLKALREHTKEVNAVDWSQTRNEHFVLSASWDKLIKLWDISQAQSIETFQGHDHIVYQVSWSPHVPGCFASASGDHSVRVWDCRRSDGCVALIPAHEAEVLSCDWCKYDQNLLFSGSVDGLIKGWDIRKPAHPVCVLRGHKYAVRRIRASPFSGSIVASASYDFSVKIWDTEQELCLDTVEHHTEFVYGLDYNLHVPGQMADCAWDELVHVYQRPLNLP